MVRHFLRDAILPPLMADLFRFFRNIPVAVFYYRYLKDNKKFEKIKSGKVFILGNGPSLRDVNFRALSGVDVITMNSFHQGDVSDDLNVVAHCFGEPVSSPAWVFEDFKDCVTSSSAESVWLHYSSISASQDLGVVAQAVVPGLEASLWPTAKTNLSFVSPGYASTAQLAIHVAMYLGYTEIVLLGFDHDWLASKDGYKHFYSDEVDKTSTLWQNSYLYILGMLQRLWRLYLSIKTRADHHGITIVNGTPGSHLDVFPLVPVGTVYGSTQDNTLDS